MTARILVDGLCFGEGPRWHDGELWLSDMHARQVLKVSAQGNKEVVVTLNDDDPSGLGWLPDGDLLIVGMTKRQVIFVMGTPLVRDPFYQDRWDYVYNFQPGGGQRVGERITVYFENDELVRIAGDFQPNPEAVN